MVTNLARAQSAGGKPIPIVPIAIAVGIALLGILAWRSGALKGLGKFFGAAGDVAGAAGDIAGDVADLSGKAVGAVENLSESVSAVTESTTAALKGVGSGFQRVGSQMLALPKTASRAVRKTSKRVGGSLKSSLLGGKRAMRRAASSATRLPRRIASKTLGGVKKAGKKTLKKLSGGLF